MEIELAVAAGKDPGVLARVLRVADDHQVSVLAYCTLFDLDCFTILLVTDAALVAKVALAEAGLDCTAHPVVLVSAEDNAAIRETLVNQLRDAGIEICYAYDAVLKPPRLCAIFSTVDDRRALRVLAATNVTHAAEG